MSVFRSVAFVMCDLLGIIGGACLIAMLTWGLYVVTAAFLTLFVSVAQNAWAIMLGVGQMEKAEKNN